MSGLDVLLVSSLPPPSDQILNFRDLNVSSPGCVASATSWPGGSRERGPSKTLQPLFLNRPAVPPKESERGGRRRKKNIPSFLIIIHQRHVTDHKVSHLSIKKDFFLKKKKAKRKTKQNESPVSYGEHPKHSFCKVYTTIFIWRWSSFKIYTYIKKKPLEDWKRGDEKHT